MPIVLLILVIGSGHLFMVVLPISTMITVLATLFLGWFDRFDSITPLTADRGGFLLPGDKMDTLTPENMITIPVQHRAFFDSLKSNNEHYAGFTWELETEGASDKTVDETGNEDEGDKPEVVTEDKTEDAPAEDVKSEDKPEGKFTQDQVNSFVAAERRRSQEEITRLTQERDELSKKLEEVESVRNELSVTAGNDKHQLMLYEVAMQEQVSLEFLNGIKGETKEELVKNVKFYKDSLGLKNTQPGFWSVPDKDYATGGVTDYSEEWLKKNYPNRNK